MAAVDPYADPEEEPTSPAAFALPPRAGSSSFLGLRPADWLAALGGLLSGVRMGPPNQVARGGGLRPGLALFPLAQGMENRDQVARNQAAIEGLAAKYGGQNNPEYDAALEVMVQDPKMGAQLLHRAITNTNQVGRENRKVAREGQAGIDATNLMGNIQVPQITSMRAVDPTTKDTGGIPLGTGDTLTLPPPVDDFKAIERPRTTDEMVKGLQALPKERQGLAAASLRAPLEKQREKDADRFRDAGEAKEAIKALGGPKGLYTASPEELESAGMMLSPGSKFGARLSIIANHRRAGDAKKDAQATRDADAQFRRDYLTGQAEGRAQNAQFQQDFKLSEQERRKGEAEDRRQAAADRLQLGRDALDARIKEWGIRAGERTGKLGVSEQKTVQQLAAMENWATQTRQSLEEMRQAGMLPSGDGLAADWKGKLSRARQPNAEALRRWQTLQPGVVGLDRAILNDLARFQKAHTGGLQFFESPPTYAGGTKILDQWDQMIASAKANVPYLVRQQQIRDGVPGGPDAPQPQGAPAPAPAAPGASAPKPASAAGWKWEPVPDAGAKPAAGGGMSAPVVAGQDNLSRRDPLYEHARSRGMTDEQIKKKYGLTVVP